MGFSSAKYIERCQLFERRDVQSLRTRCLYSQGSPIKAWSGKREVGLLVSVGGCVVCTGPQALSALMAQASPSPSSWQHTATPKLLDPPLLDLHLVSVQVFLKVFPRVLHACVPRTLSGGWL